MIFMSARYCFLAACLSCALLASSTINTFGQTNYYTTNGTEYAVIGSLPGDQVHPDAAITADGGFVVWQDNITDGSGLGISARQLDSTLSGTLGTFRVNAQGANNQENPRVALLPNGGAVFVWQGGAEGFQHIYARYLNANNTFVTTTDLLVSAPGFNQINPAVATLNNSNVVVVWSSYNEAARGSMQDVYAQILSPTGQKIGSEFLVNQFTNFNQRSPAIAALTNGGFVVAWVSEQERQVSLLSGSNEVSNATSGIVTASVDIYARLYNASGTPAGNEFLVNNDFKPCASPAVAGAADGSFMVVWTAHDLVSQNNSWDIWGRSFSGSGTGGQVVTVNTHTYGDQYHPRIDCIGLDYLVTWTSLGEDGSLQGVYGQFVHNDGSLTGGQFQINETTAGQQDQAAVASDGSSQFLAVWTGFTGGPTYGMDLYAQRYANVNGLMQPLSAPLVFAPFNLVKNVYQPQLEVSWAPIQGLAVSKYEVYVNGAPQPKATVTLVSNLWTMTAAHGLRASSTNTFQVDYVTTDGRRSPLSRSSKGITWSGLSWDGVPYEWMAEFYGGRNGSKFTTGSWPTAGTRLGPNMTLGQIFVSGSSPLDPRTWLKSQMAHTSQGSYLTWNTSPGHFYQVQVSTNFTTWVNVGFPRYSAGTTDSIYVGGGRVGYYRLQFLR